MKYPINFESPRNSSVNFLTILGGSVITAGVIGAVVGFVGYVPRVEFPVMTASVSMGEMMVGLILGPLLAYALFRGRIYNRVFYGSAKVCLIVGVIAAVVFRLLTAGEGGWLAGLPAILEAIAAAVYFKIRT